MKLAPTAVHYIMWAIGLFLVAAPKVLVAFPTLAPVIEQLQIAFPLVLSHLGTASGSAYQSGQAAGSTPQAITVEQALAVIAQATKGGHAAAPPSPAVAPPAAGVAS